MTKELAIKIIDNESIQRFPSEVSCEEYAEAKKIVMDAACKELSKNDTTTTK